MSDNFFAFSVGNHQYKMLFPISHPVATSAQRYLLEFNLLELFRTRHKFLHGQIHKEMKPRRLVLCEGRLSVNTRGNFSGDALAPSNKTECCCCQAETSGHLITDKWGLVLASARINPFCKHSYPNLRNMSFHNCTKMFFYLSLVINHSMLHRSEI